MNDIETLACELIELARASRLAGDIESLKHGGFFVSAGRSIYFWRSGLAINYDLSGVVQVLPTAFKDSSSAFRGIYSEVGNVDSLDRALILLVSWLFDRVEVEDLPKDRKMKNQSIA